MLTILAAVVASMTVQVIQSDDGSYFLSTVNLTSFEEKKGAKLDLSYRPEHAIKNATGSMLAIIGDGNHQLVIVDAASGKRVKTDNVASPKFITQVWWKDDKSVVANYKSEDAEQSKEFNIQSTAQPKTLRRQELPLRFRTHMEGANLATKVVLANNTFPIWHEQMDGPSAIELFGDQFGSSYGDCRISAVVVHVLGLVRLLIDVSGQAKSSADVRSLGFGLGA